METYQSIMFLVGCLATGIWSAKLFIWLATRMADSIVEADERRHQANRRAQDVAAALAMQARQK